ARALRGGWMGAADGRRLGGSMSEAAEPGGRAPAPGELSVVQDFINSIDREEGTEELDTTANSSAWLYGHGLTRSRPRLTRGDVDRARRFRELLRALALANNGVPIDPGLIDEANHELA